MRRATHAQRRRDTDAAALRARPLADFTAIYIVRVLNDGTAREEEARRLKEAAAAVLKARAADSDCESFVSISNDGRVKDGVWAAVRSPPIPTHRGPFS